MDREGEWNVHEGIWESESVGINEGLEGTYMRMLVGDRIPHLRVPGQNSYRDRRRQIPFVVSLLLHTGEIHRVCSQHEDIK